MTSINIELQGLQQLISKLEQVEGASDTIVLETITDLVTDTHTFAVAGIEGGPKSGRTYVRRGVSHTASSPGQYPATDTGSLAKSVRMELPQAGDLTGRVGTALTVGLLLETGTSRMAARPWLLPSFERAKVGVEKELRARWEAKT